jgi:ribonuclease HIII
LSEPISIGDYDKILGIDESGKGDFFGPLVIAGVVADRKGAKQLLDAGVKDSKKISDNKIHELSSWVAGRFRNSIIIIGPRKYNQLYASIKNLNRLLAWGHSRVIENIAAHQDIDLAISDKFGRSDFIERALMEKGKKIRLHQEVRAEAIAQVAAASILARAAFMRYLKKLSDTYGLELPKGAGSLVDQAGARLAAKHGVDILSDIAKIHFKNYRKVLDLI